MTDTRKIFSTIILMLLLTSIRGQYGQFEIKIKLTDKTDCNIINDSLLSSVEKGTSITFDTLNFYVPMDPSEKLKRIKDHDLRKKQLTGFNIGISWDTQKNQAAVLGYAPTYSTRATYPFYFSGSFNKVFKKNHDDLIRQSIKRSLFQSANNFSLQSTDSTTFRKIPINQFDCIYHAQFSYLPKLLFAMFGRGELIFYDESDLFTWTSRTEDSPSQFENAKTVVLCELWSDTTIVSEGFGPNPLPFDTYYLKKKIKSIGLVLSNGKTVWANYDSFKKILLNSKYETSPGKVALYELYFQSDFCRHLKMDMYIK